MRLVATLVVGSLVLLLGGRAVYLALLSDEGHVQRRIELMVEGFNGTRANPVLDGLAPTFRSDPDGVDRETLRGGLAHLFFTAIDPETKRFLYRVELEGEPVVEALDGATEPALVSELTAVFTRGFGESEELQWRARIEGTWERDADGEWRLVSATHESLGGDGPPRGGRR